MATMKDFTILLRAVSTAVPATEMLYSAASRLTENDEANTLILGLVADLLGLSDNKSTRNRIERVLRALPKESE